jgi:hypothetical protein
MKKNYLGNPDANNGINSPQVVEKSTVIAQILGYSPPAKARAIVLPDLNVEVVL